MGICLLNCVEQEENSVEDRAFKRQKRGNIYKLFEQEFGQTFIPNGI